MGEWNNLVDAKRTVLAEHYNVAKDRISEQYALLHPTAKETSHHCRRTVYSPLFLASPSRKCLCMYTIK